MDPSSTNVKKVDLTPVEQDGDTYLVTSSDIDFFLKNISHHIEFQIDFTEAFDRREFIQSPYLGSLHSYDASKQILNFKYDSDDPEYDEHITCSLSDIRRILFRTDPRSKDWMFDETA